MSNSLHLSQVLIHLVAEILNFVFHRPVVDGAVHGRVVRVVFDPRIFTAGEEETEGEAEEGDQTFHDPTYREGGGFRKVKIHPRLLLRNEWSSASGLPARGRPIDTRWKRALREGEREG